MDKDLAKIKKLTRFMKKNGVLNLKTPDSYQIAIHPDAVDTARSRRSSLAQQSPPPDPIIEDQYDEEETLFWSTNLTLSGETN